MNEAKLVGLDWKRLFVLFAVLFVAAAMLGCGRKSERSNPIDPGYNGPAGSVRGDVDLKRLNAHSYHVDESGITVILGKDNFETVICTTQTDNGSYFHFENVPIGRWCIKAEKPGYLPIVDYLKVPYGRADTIEVAINYAGEKIDLSRKLELYEASASVSGRLTDTDGNPVGSVELWIEEAKTVTDANGDFSFPYVYTNDTLEIRTWGNDFFSAVSQELFLQKDQKMTINLTANRVIKNSGGSDASGIELTDTKLAAQSFVSKGSSIVGLVFTGNGAFDSVEVREDANGLPTGKQLGKYKWEHGRPPRHFGAPLTVTPGSKYWLVVSGDGGSHNTSSDSYADGELLYSDNAGQTWDALPPGHTSLSGIDLTFEIWY